MACSPVNATWLLCRVAHGYGNVWVILAVTYLGQGVGNSLVQSKILISGLWGICWYKEIKERPAIFKWFFSATVAIIGVLWLSYEHKSGGH